MKNGLNSYDGIVEISFEDKSLYRVANKGMQPKWHKDDIWIKMDTNQYEGLAETIVSDILGY